MRHQLVENTSGRHRLTSIFDTLGHAHDPESCVGRTVRKFAPAENVWSSWGTIQGVSGRFLLVRWEGHDDRVKECDPRLVVMPAEPFPPAVAEQIIGIWYGTTARPWKMVEALAEAFPAYPWSALALARHPIPEDS